MHYVFFFLCFFQLLTLCFVLFYRLFVLTMYVLTPVHKDLASISYMCIKVMDALKVRLLIFALKKRSLKPHFTLSLAFDHVM